MPKKVKIAKTIRLDPKLLSTKPNVMSRLKRTGYYVISKTKHTLVTAIISLPIPLAAQKYRRIVYKQISFIRESAS